MWYLYQNVINLIMAQERLKWIDVARGLAFLMVIYCHLPMCNSQLMLFFEPVFLTTFFFVSGYLFKSGASFSVVLEQRVRTLLIPFLILGFIMIGMGQVLSFNEKIELKDAVTGLLLQNGDNQILWFVGALFVYSLVFYWVDRLSVKMNILLIVCVALYAVNCVVLHWLKIPYQAVPWHVLGMGCACFYMALGKVYRTYEDKIDKFFNLPLTIALLLFYISFIYYTGNNFNIHGSAYMIDSMAITIIGLFLIIHISKKYLSNLRLLLFVGANSLFYFAFHGKAYSFILFALKKGIPSYAMGSDVWTDICVGIMVVMADALILIVPAHLTQKYLPQIYGRNFKLW